GGKKELMDQLSPEGGVYQAGTLSGNPLAMHAGIATLKLIKEEGFYAQIEEKSAYLEQGLRDAATNAPFPTSPQRVGSMFCTYFCAGPVKNFADASKSDTEAFSRYFCSMLDQGINLAPSQFEAGFMSIAHSREDLDKTIEAAQKAFKSL
ncbi:MAG: aminotransferase class III-fold pyridoxal phosphate-dependent enzyme, partial [Geobacteraceae bacterium]|nr:aminotransferase class III-fold pyridoxal phosphate-dependent enzyme [Geobacteraceae bacterium]